MIPVVLTGLVLRRKLRARTRQQPVGVMAQIEFQGALNEAQGIGGNISIRGDVVWSTKPHSAGSNSTATRKRFAR
jgi:hypothetical protein